MSITLQCRMEGYVLNSRFRVEPVCSCIIHTQGLAQSGNVTDPRSSNPMVLRQSGQRQCAKPYRYGAEELGSLISTSSIRVESLIATSSSFNE